MAFRTLSRTVSSRLTRQLRPAVQARTFAALTAAARPTVARATVAASQFQSRGVKTVDFAGHKEQVYERADWPREKLLVCSIFSRHFGGNVFADTLSQEYFKNDTLALIGYGKSIS